MQLKNKAKNFFSAKQNFLFSCVSRLLIYGVYCSQVEIAIAVLDLICKEKEDVRLKLEVRCLLICMHAKIK